MNLKTTLSLTLIATLIILSAGCIDNNIEPDVVYVYVTPTPNPTPEPTVVSTPEPKVINHNVEILKRYDIDNNGKLDKFELKVIETDYFYKLLTPKESKAFIEILGYTPQLNPIPTPKPSLPTLISPNPIPDDYYDADCEDIIEGNIYNYLKYWKWNKDNQYEIDEFDCSQMSTYMEFILENSGYNVVIALQDGTTNKCGHAWILVEFSDGWLAYECTECCWIFPDESTAKSYASPGEYYYWDDGLYYTPDHILEDIYEVSDFCDQFINGEKLFIDEFSWWIE